MSSNNQILIQIETIQKIIKEINEISILCAEPHLKMKVEGLQDYVSSILDLSTKPSVEEIIYDEMVKVKHTNPDLHLKLYMLYRNLISGRISQVDAMSSFESCLSLFPLDEIIF